MARAQQQESAPPPATIDPRDVADRRPNVLEPDFTIIGLEYRYGLMRGLQAGIYRSSSKTIQFFGQ